MRQLSRSLVAVTAALVTTATLVLTAASPASAQPSSPAGAGPFTFEAQREDHIHRQEAVLGYLAGAAGVSLAAGTALMLTDAPGFRDRDHTKQYRQSFAMLCLIYGGLNAAFVGANLAGLGQQREKLTTPWLLEADRRRQSRALAMNAGLDMIYMTLGFTLAAIDDRPIVQGMGLGIATQGGFLLGFDAAGALALTH